MSHTGGWQDYVAPQPSGGDWQDYKPPSQTPNGAPKYRDAYGTSSDEIEALLKNPGYQFLGPDPKFPNRQPGVYPTGPGNEWRNDPDLNARKGNPDQWPIDAHLAKHAYQSGKQAVAMGAAPLAMEATIPQLIGGVVGGTAGTVGGQKIAEAAGAGETGQEISGDVGSVVGGILGAGLGEGAANIGARIYKALPKELQQEVLGAISPRLLHGVKVAKAVSTMLSEPKAAGEAGSIVQSIAAPAETSPAAALGKIPLRTAADPSALARIPLRPLENPGSAGSIVQSVTAPKNPPVVDDFLTRIARQEAEKAATRGKSPAPPERPDPMDPIARAQWQVSNRFEEPMEDVGRTQRNKNPEPAGATTRTAAPPTEPAQITDWKTFDENLAATIKKFQAARKGANTRAANRAAKAAASENLEDSLNKMLRIVQGGGKLSDLQ